MKDYNLSEQCQMDFLASLDRAEKEPVDLCVPNHITHGPMLERVAAGMRLYEPGDWRKMLNIYRQKYHAMISAEERSTKLA
ncbi:MAG: hypothetical protein PHS41_01680 [Victivallaceae bacterium]|nr:hypothetical protein [Victivallaceae bacterium]